MQSCLDLSSFPLNSYMSLICFESHSKPPDSWLERSHRLWSCPQAPNYTYAICDKDQYDEYGILRQKYIWCDDILKRGNYHIICIGNLTLLRNFVDPYRHPRNTKVKKTKSPASSPARQRTNAILFVSSGQVGGKQSMKLITATWGTYLLPANVRQIWNSLRLGRIEALLSPHVRLACKLDLQVEMRIHERILSRYILSPDELDLLNASIGVEGILVFIQELFHASNNMIFPRYFGEVAVSMIFSLLFYSSDVHLK